MSRLRITAIPHPVGQVVQTDPLHVIDPRRGIEIPVAGARQLLIHLGNDGPSAATMTIRGGDPALSHHGNSEDEHVQVAPMESRVVGPIDTDAFAQKGGVIWLDFTTETVGRVSAFRLG
jgi:hypothetical protein